MKKKLLLILLFHLFLGSSVCGKNLFEDEILSNFNLDFYPEISTLDSIKKIKNFKKVSKFLAVLPPPITTAGSACGDGSSLVQVNVSAFGSNGNETIEWFTSQASSAPIYTGSIYSPSISTTKTYYVRSRLGSDFSTRVPVVASIYVAPPAVTLTASPPNNATSPLCYGTSVTFTASGGADLFEFSIDGVVMQTMSTSRVFTTNTLTDGQVVKVRSRYAVIMDGSITETAWGTGSLEDNVLSSPLSPNAINGYVNAFKISALEDKVVIGVAGKIVNNRSILVFLDTKAGGFNISNYSDESTIDPLVRAFNIFNNSLSTFDSYFLADYCLIISTDSAETNYYANIIELRTGNSIKTFIGSAATGFPSAVIGVNKNNSGIADYNLGFEVQLLKSLIGYTNGDIKFFAFTMNDGQQGSQSVTNSFLSPERSSSLDYGIAAVDYNFKDPNPVVVASAALTPCYSETNITMNFVSVPITASVVQPTCAITTGIIKIESQTGVEYSLDGVVYQNSETFSGLTPGNYTLYVRNKLDTTCILLSATPVTINAVPTPPAVPTTANVIQPTCAVASGSITVTTQSGVSYSLNGTSYQASNVFSGLPPGSYTLYVRNTADNTCVTASNNTTTINTIPTPPAAPTTVNVVQPTCAVPAGSITITTQNGVAYSLNGTSYQTSNVFTGLAPGSYTLYVRNIADTTCVTTSSANTTINTVPTPPAAPTTANVVQPTCGVPSGSITITTQNGVAYSLNGTTYQASNVFTGLAPGSYTLYVRNIADTTCVTTSSANTTINAVPTPPVAPTTANVVQPTCAVPSGSITITTQNGVAYSLNGTTYQASNVFTGLAPGNYTLYVRNTSDNTCVNSSTSNTTINVIPTPPVAPTKANVVQPTCGVPSGSITVTTQNGVAYSLNGTTYQASNVFTGLAPGSYTLYVRNIADTTCVTTSSANTTINTVPTPPVAPTTANVVQPTCAVPSGSITITTQNGVAYSLNGTTYQASNVFTGLAPGSYTLYVRNTADTTCVTTSTVNTTINTVPTPPVAPTTANVVQPTCAVPSGSITITTQNGVAYSLNGTSYQASNVFTGLAPGSYTLYVRNIADTTCVTASSANTTINAVPTPPAAPTTVNVVQPTCAVPSGSITINTQNGVAYSLNGTSYQTSNVFSGLAPGSYTLYVRNSTDSTCVTSSSANTTINAVPTPPAVPTTVNVVQPTCVVPSGSISITTQNGVSYSLNGTSYQTSNVFTGIAPGSYTLYVRNTTDTTCVTTSTINTIINAVPTPPPVPTVASVVQPTCAVPSGSITVTTQSGVSYSLNGTSYQASNVFSGLPPGSYTLYVRNIADNTCVTASNSTTTINTIPTPPVASTVASVVQPTCAVPSGSITITTQNGVAYSLNGTTYQASNVFTGLAPGSYTLYVRNSTDTTCVTSSSANTTINAVPTPPAVPTTINVVQPTCAVPSGSITITTQNGVAYSLNGTSYQTSNVFTGLAPESYTLYVRNIADTTCVTTSSANTTINAVPTPPVAPTTANVVQPTCGVPSGSITITTQNGVAYSLNGTAYQTSNVFTGLAPGSYTLYVRNITDTTCVTTSTSNTTINPLPALPSTPTVSSVVQPTCAVQFGSITITSQPNVQYSIGNGYQNSSIFNALPPGKYIISVRFTNSIACITQGSEVTIMPIPAQIQFETTGDCDNNQFIVTANPLMGSYDLSTVSYQWRDNTGVSIGTNSNILNVSDAIASRPNGQFVFPTTFTLTVTATNTGCVTTSSVVIESAYCNIQKGISPDGNGSNDVFDLRMMNIKNLEVFNRYGIKVYNQVNYTDQWKGQSNAGDDLPGATYYYVIEFNSGESKTGWIYLIREK